jgi:hypothetical protein
MPQPAMPGMTSGGEMMPGQDPAQLLGTGQDGDPLNGLPPEVLEALGVSPTPPEAPGVTAGGPLQIKRETTPGNSTAPSQPTDPGNVVPFHRHPKVQAALKTGEAHAKKLAAQMGKAK